MMLAIALLLSVQFSTTPTADELSPEARQKIDELDQKYGIKTENLVYRNRGFFRTYFPASLEPIAVKQVEAAMWPVIIVNALLPCGGLWAPLIFLEDRPDFESTLIGPFFLPYIISNLILYGSYGSAGVGLASVYGSPLSIGFGVLGCAGCVMANWQAPMASLNAWNDLYIREIVRERNKIIEEDKARLASPGGTTIPQTNSERGSPLPPEVVAPDEPLEVQY